MAILTLYAVVLVNEPGRFSLPRVAGLLFGDAAVLFMRLGLAKEGHFGQWFPVFVVSAGKVFWNCTGYDQKCQKLALGERRGRVLLGLSWEGATPVCRHWKEHHIMEKAIRLI